MSRTKGPEKLFHSGIISDEESQLVLEINELVRVRTALSFGTRAGTKQSAESTISRKINAKVLQLSELVLKNHKE